MGTGLKTTKIAEKQTEEVEIIKCCSLQEGDTMFFNIINGTVCFLRGAQPLRFRRGFLVRAVSSEHSFGTLLKDKAVCFSIAQTVADSHNFMGVREVESKNGYRFEFY